VVDIDIEAEGLLHEVAILKTTPTTHRLRLPMINQLTLVLHRRPMVARMIEGQDAAVQDEPEVEGGEDEMQQY
jgi:hypothetical protein